jgi:hypothetical protein
MVVGSRPLSYGVGKVVTMYCGRESNIISALTNKRTNEVKAFWDVKTCK